MSLIVETGSCVPTANAFVTRAGLIAYAADYYPAVTVADNTDTDAAIMRATSWLSTFPIWDGAMKCGRGLQGQAFPRTGVTDCDGEAVPDDEVPVELEHSTYIASLAEISSPGVLTPTITPGKQKKSVKVDVIGETYMTPVEQGVKGSANPIETLRPVLTAINDLLRCMATLPDGKTVPWPWVA
jgi:hypothetical protein